MISQSTFQEGIALLEAATGTRFHKQHTDLWRGDFLQSWTDDNFLRACRSVAKTWSMASKFPTLAALNEAHNTDSPPVPSTRDPQLTHKEQTDNALFAADLQQANRILKDLDPESQADFQHQADLFTKADPFWQRPTPANAEVLGIRHLPLFRKAWQDVLLLHILNVRKFPWLTELQTRIQATPQNV